MQYYGRDLAASAVLDAKRKTLGAASDFHQRIVGRVDAAPLDGERVALSFTKQSGSGGKMHDVAAKLVLRKGAAAHYEIVEETDTVTEARAQARASCEATAAGAAESLPKVKAVTDELVRAAEASGGRAHFAALAPSRTPTD